MSIVNIVSALGNNSSIYPLLVRDCGIENVAKVVMTYNQNAKDSKFIARQATRERIIDEYGTSAVWLGGIPLFNKISDKVIEKCGLSPVVDMRLLGKSSVQGVDSNILKFKKIAKNEVQDLIKIKNRKIAYRNAQVLKFLATTLIPISLMGFLLPKLNFSYTKKKLEKISPKKNKNVKFSASNTSMMFKSFNDFAKSKKGVNFSGIEKLANMSNLEKMVVLDGGLTVGRVKTARNKGEKAEMAFKMAGMCYLNYVAPKSIEKGLNKLTWKLFGYNTNLDIKTLTDSEFSKKIKSNGFNFPPKTDEKSLLDFVDGNMNSFFVNQAKKVGLVKSLKNGVRDPRKFVDCEKLVDLKNSISEFAIQARNSSDVDKFIKNAIRAKCFNTLINIGLSSVLLAVVLPKLQFLFRQITQKTNVEPGLKEFM